MLDASVWQTGTSIEKKNTVASQTTGYCTMSSQILPNLNYELAAKGLVLQVNCYLHDFSNVLKDNGWNLNIMICYLYLEYCLSRYLLTFHGDGSRGIDRTGNAVNGEFTVYCHFVLPVMSSLTIGSALENVP